MFGTFIHDDFNFETHRKLQNSIEEIASAVNIFGWASTGIYFFRELPSNDVLYVGLATNLSKRFAEHTGLRPCPSKSCKFEQIKGYLEQNKKIGLTLFLQSQVDQSTISTNKNANFISVDPNGENAIKFTEGYFIRLFEKSFSRKPLWNLVNGCKGGQGLAERSQSEYLVHCINPEFTNPFTSRLSINELADDSNCSSLYCELDVHMIRMWALNFPHNDLRSALKDGAKILKLADKARYLELAKLGYLDFLLESLTIKFE